MPVDITVLLVAKYTYFKAVFSKISENLSKLFCYHRSISCNNEGSKYTYQFPEIIPEWMAATIFQDHSCMYYYIQSQTKIKISDLLSLCTGIVPAYLYMFLEFFFFHLCLSYKCAMGPNNSPFKKSNITYIRLL